MSKTKLTKKSEFKPELIQCPCCGGVFFETTSEFEPDATVTHSMIQMLKKYRDYGWQEVISDDAAGYGSIICPECESMLAPNGKIRLVG